MWIRHCLIMYKFEEFTCYSEAADDLKFQRMKECQFFEMVNLWPNDALKC